MTAQGEGPAPVAWRTVPVEPTEAMHRAGLRVTAYRLAPSWTALNVYAAMLAASPAPDLAGMRETVWAFPPLLVAVRDMVTALPDDVVEAHAEAFNRVSETLESIPLDGLRALLVFMEREGLGPLQPEDRASVPGQTEDRTGVVR